MLEQQLKMEVEARAGDLKKSNPVGRALVNSKKQENESSNNGAFDVNKLQKLIVKEKKKTDTVTKASKVEPKKKPRPTKKNRVWDDLPTETKLDFTDPVGENGEGHIEVVATDQGESMMDKEEILSDAKKKGWFSSMFQSIAGKANLEKSDLKPALKALKDRLMTKNVAEEIAEKLYESVGDEIVAINGFEVQGKSSFEVSSLLLWPGKI
ncbi:hypothetical protein K1719_002794 [Acacia pycnantha]|nr:hypothetical protein K1719_002794 [Acacia pycnantha]